MSTPTPRDCPFDPTFREEDLYTFRDGDPIETEEYFGAIITGVYLGWTIYGVGVLALIGIIGGLCWVVS